MSDEKPKPYYVPPSNEQIDKFAQDVCIAFDCNTHEIRTGFASFVKVAARIQCNALNRENGYTDEIWRHK